MTISSITIKDSTDTDRVFTVIRQPSGTQSAILQLKLDGTDMNRTAFPKVELSSKVVNGRTEPVATVTVPYGTVADGAFVKKGQVNQIMRATQPADAPQRALADAEAYGRNLLADPQVQALFAHGLMS